MAMPNAFGHPISEKYLLHLSFNLLVAEVALGWIIKKMKMRMKVVGQWRSQIQKKNGQWIGTETIFEMHCLKYRGILDVPVNIGNFGRKKKIGRYKKFKWKKEKKERKKETSNPLPIIACHNHVAIMLLSLTRAPFSSSFFFFFFSLKLSA